MIESTTRVLLVDNNPEDAHLFEQLLGNTNTASYSLMTAQQLNEVAPLFVRQRPDLLVVDLELPDSNGLETLRCVLDVAPETPVIVLTAADDEETGIRALQQGAQDYLTKREVDARTLQRALRYALERHRLKAALSAQSLTDELTRLHNRRGFLSLSQRHLDLARRNKTNHLLLFADLDGLEQINRTLGHEDGDHALREAAHVLRCSFRDTDVLARLGSDEFAVLAVDAGSEHSPIILNRIAQEVEKRNATTGRRFRLSLALGLHSWSRAENPFLEGWMERTDAVMHEEKRARRAARSPVPFSQVQETRTAGFSRPDTPDARRQA
jgi:two-component system cell cycle response regulator